MPQSFPCYRLPQITSYLVIALALLTLIAFPFTAAAQTSQAKAAKEIDVLMRTAHERGILNGVVLVAVEDSIVYQSAFGYVDGSRKAQLTPAHRFKIGSISKEFSAVGLMMLEEQGLLSLDDPVARLLPSLPDWAGQVEVGHLLTYTSGLPHIDEDRVTSDADILGDLRSLAALAFEPGTGFLYSNNNVFLRERIIEAATGRTYTDFAQNRLFAPCKMDAAVIDPAPRAEMIARAFDNAYVEDDKEAPWSGTSYLTAADLHRWTQCLHAGTLITAPSLLRLAESFEGGKSALGQSEVIDGAFKWHGHVGSSYNFEAGYYVNRADDLTVVILTNNKNFKVGSLAMAVEAILKGHPYEVPRKSLYLALRTEIYHKGFEAGLAFYEDLRANQRDLYDLSDEEDDIDDTGHYLLREDRVQDAIRVFELNVSLFPESASAYESLGEAQLAAGDEEEAVRSYRRSLALDPSNERAQAVLSRLGS